MYFTFFKTDLHVHLPAGAIGKDGPSAGCAFTLALFSLISGLNVRKDSAVTGEVTLTGNVLAVSCKSLREGEERKNLLNFFQVGGIKEKILAAHRNKIYRIVLPEANRKDVEDIDASIRVIIYYYSPKL